MKKRLIAMVLSASLAADALAGCSDGSGKETAPARASAVDTSKESKGQTGSQGTADASADPSADPISTSMSVTGDSHTIATTTFAEKVKELSGGSVIYKTYSNSTLFSSENEFDALLSGDADLTYIPFLTLAIQSGPRWCSMVASGYSWSSYDHMTNTLDGGFEEEVFGNTQGQINCIPMSASYLGSRVVNTKSKEISTYEDMGGILFRMPNSETRSSLGEALRANPILLPFSELYTALQTGAVDAQESPLPMDVNAAFYEMVPYIAITNHVIGSIPPCINMDIWNSMTDAQKAAVTKAMECAKSVNDGVRIEEEEKGIVFLEEKGCTITYLDLVESKEKIQAYCTSHPKQTETWDMDLHDRTQVVVNQEAALISDHALISREQTIPIPCL